MVVARSVEFAFIAYGFLFAIALAVAAMIKLIYWVVHRSSKAKPNEGKEA
jgi:hypothetical protein